jgi:hypothetical protein
VLKFSLPVAPGLNNATRNIPGRGRAKTAVYKQWLKQADAEYVIQGLGRAKKVAVPYTCEMHFPEYLRGDLDGRAKLLLDFMVSRNLTIDDSFCMKLVLERCRPAGDARVQIEVKPYARSLLPDRARAAA